MKQHTGMTILLYSLFVVGCAPQNPYHDFSEVEWVPITEVFQEAYSVEYEDDNQQTTTYVPLSSAELTSLTDGEQDANWETVSNSRGFRFQAPIALIAPLYISDLRIRVIFSRYHSNADLNDGAIKIASWITDQHHEYDLSFSYKEFQGEFIDVCTSDVTRCNPHGNHMLWMKDYEINFHQYRMDEDGTYDWSIDGMVLKISGLSLGYYFVKLDEIYVKVVSNIVMPE